MLRLACLWLASAALAMSLEAGAAAEVHPDRKRVLILGDSISIGYTPFVRETLQADAVVVRPTLSDGQPENCDGTTKGVKGLDRWLRLDGGRGCTVHPAVVGARLSRAAALSDAGQALVCPGA